ncbi:MAG TPA: ABC transporter substrate-binding protein [Chloroflexota bacterium]|nr:ABC transporter substrate-binding protein [Chloroflexota bacterium]
MSPFPRPWLALLVVVWLAACGGGASAPSSAPAANGSGANSGAAPTAPAAPVTTGVSPEQARQPLTIGFANVTAVHSALWAALEGGTFARNGLDVDLVNLGRSQAVQAALLSREVVIASVSGSSTVNVRLAGGDLVIIGSTFDTMPYQLATTRDITTLTDLRGKSIGVNSFGGAADSILRFLLRQAGVDPERETTILQVGAQNERVAALRSGAVQATLVDPPFGSIAEKEGLRVLLDTTDLGIAYPQDVLVVNREWLASNRDTARRVLQSVADGEKAFKSDRELGIRTVKKWLQLDDQATAEETYAYYARVLPDDLLPRLEGLQLVIDEVATDHPEARSLRPEDLLDASVAREVK